MPQEGVVEQWDEARGFGFVRSQGSRIFFHVRDFRAGGGPPPRLGMEVRFELIHVGGKGPRAMTVTPLTAAGDRVPSTRRAAIGARHADRQAHGRSTGQLAIILAWSLMAAWVAAIGWGVIDRRLPGWVPPSLLLLNIATFWSYWLDKHAAKTQQWRTRESQLHLLALLGGWPAAWWAQEVLRHKSIKPAFRQAYVGTVVVHCAVLATWLAGVVPQTA